MVSNLLRKISSSHKEGEYRRTKSLIISKVFERKEMQENEAYNGQ